MNKIKPGFPCLGEEITLFPLPLSTSIYFSPPHFGLSALFLIKLNYKQDAIYINNTKYYQK